jgi:hypothetical protein
VKGFVSKGKYVDEFRFSFGCTYPDAYVRLSATEKENSKIGDSQCFIPPDLYFLRCILEIPIRDHHEPFLWGLWVLMHEQDFNEFDDHWNKEGKEHMIGPYKVRIANNLRVYSPTTLNVKARIIVQPVGERALIIVDESEHPIAKQQKFGIDKGLAAELSRKAIELYQQ